MQKIRWLFLIIGILLILAMAFQNNELTEVRLLWLSPAFPLSVLLLVCTAIGFLLGSLVTVSMLRRSKTAGKKRKKGTAKAAGEQSPGGP